MYGRIKKIHFVGIGGIGMSGIAEVLLNLGYQISGSDLASSEITERLISLGATIYPAHLEENIQDVDVVVTSTAVRVDNPEVVEAHRQKIPVIPRAEMLAELMRMKYGVAVAGTHGKTTTTSMLATILAHGGIDPTVVIGGRLDSLGSNAKLGQGDFLVAEADESDGSFMKLSPTIAIVTNIDADHLDYYRDLDEIKETFISFMNKVPFFGMTAICLDDSNIQSCIPEITKRFVTYGISTQADLHASDLSYDGTRTSFTVNNRDGELGRICLHMPGRHNVLNALAAISVGIELDLPFATIAEGLNGFGGIQRRFQIKHDRDGIMVVDDYGHHPTEIIATLDAARNGWNKRLVVIFQPHRYSRTEALYDEFMTAFNESDHLVIMDVYAAGEDPIPGVEGKDLAEGVAGHGHNDVHFIADPDAVVAHLKNIVTENDLVLTLGAGNVWKIGEAFISELVPCKP
jgi:UDP-N-acetylmuramate--alanine ligase